MGQGYVRLQQSLQRNTAAPIETRGDTKGFGRKDRIPQGKDGRLGLSQQEDQAIRGDVRPENEGKGKINQRNRHVQGQTGPSTEAYLGSVRLTGALVERREEDDRRRKPDCR